MQIIGQSLQHSRIPPDIVEVIIQSWRDSTRKQYKVYINKWLQFCCEGPHDPSHPSVRSLLSFLHNLFKKGLSYSALNTARSAVSSIHLTLMSVMFKIIHQWGVSTSLFAVTLRVFLTSSNLCQDKTTFALLTLFWIT